LFLPEVCNAKSFVRNPLSRMNLNAPNNPLPIGFSYRNPTPFSSSIFSSVLVVSSSILTLASTFTPLLSSDFFGSCYYCALRSEGSVILNTLAVPDIASFAVTAFFYYY